MSSSHRSDKGKPMHPITDKTTGEDIGRMQTQFAIQVKDTRRLDTLAELVTLAKEIHGDGRTEETRQAFYRIMKEPWLSASCSHLLLQRQLLGRRHSATT